MSGTSRPRFKIRRIIRAVGCKEDHQCPTGFFCEVTQLSCRPCMSCSELNRLPLQANLTSCVTSVTACGACIAGLLPSPSDNKCVLPVNQQLLLPYEWAIIAVCLVLAVIICAAAVHVLRNLYFLKIYTRTSVHAPVDVEASAPQLPPAYNDVAALPPANPLGQNDERAPFIKPISPPRADNARESAKRQVARIDNIPAYVRNAQLPSDDNNQSNIQGALPTIQESATDFNSNEDSFNSSNETPSDIEDSNANGRQVALKPSAKLLQARQDGNNNSDEESHDGAFTHGGAAFVINVINGTTVQQRNQLTL